MAKPRLDHEYPGYNFNISDQRRAQEFIKDFDRMVAAGTLPTFLYIYQPNDHTGGIQAPNAFGGLNQCYASSQRSRRLRHRARHGGQPPDEQPDLLRQEHGRRQRHLHDLR